MFQTVHVNFTFLHSIISRHYLNNHLPTFLRFFNSNPGRDRNPTFFTFSWHTGPDAAETCAWTCHPLSPERLQRSWEWENEPRSIVGGHSGKMKNRKVEFFRDPCRNFPVTSCQKITSRTRLWSRVVLFRCMNGGYSQRTVWETMFFGKKMFRLWQEEKLTGEFKSR